MPTYYTTTTNTTTANNWYYYIPTATTVSWTTKTANTDCSGYYSWTMPAKEKEININEDELLELLQGDED